MTKSLEEIAFNPHACRMELAALKRFLDSKVDLGNGEDLVPATRMNRFHSGGYHTCHT